MAAVASDTVNIVINDVPIAVPKGELIVESVKRLGLEIPIFCYHARMKPVGMCRMCLVEIGFKQPDGSVRKMPKPQAACTLPASEGMVVFTDTEMVHRDRKGVLEFLLVNHPLDCPICDRGGECPLQNNTLFYGPSTSRFIEVKRHAPKAFPLSNYVTLDLERCIQCGRCVRFTEEISGDSELAFRFRGAQMQPSTFEMLDFESKFSGNVIEICPVGALTNREYRFRARPWDLQTKPAICTVCSNGCNVWFDYRVNQMVRINGRTNEAVNEEWTCDKGKFGHEFYNESRLTTPMIRNGDRLEECDWPTAYAAIFNAFQAGGNRVAILGGQDTPNEGVFLMAHLFRSRFNSNNMDYRWTSHLQTSANRLESVLGQKQVQTPIAALETKSNILVFGTSLADDEPIAFLRVRKAWFQNAAHVVAALDRDSEADSFATMVLRYLPGTEAALANGLLAAAVDSGRAQVPDATKTALPNVRDAAAESGVPEHKIREAAALIGENGAVITSYSMLNAEHAQDALETLGGLAMSLKAEFNCYGMNANDQGCDELGFVPYGGKDGEVGLGTAGILEGCADGSVEALWLLNADPFTLYGDQDMVERALESVPFLVVQGTNDLEALHYASVVLPMAAPAESEGTYTNCERRVQEIQPVLSPRGQAKPAWKIASEMLLRTGGGTPFFNAGEVLEEIRKTFPAFADLELGPDGTLLK